MTHETCHRCAKALQSFACPLSPQLFLHLPPIKDRSENTSLVNIHSRKKVFCLPHSPLSWSPKSNDQVQHIFEAYLRPTKHKTWQDMTGTEIWLTSLLQRKFSRVFFSLLFLFWSFACCSHFVQMFSEQLHSEYFRYLFQLTTQPVSFTNKFV